MFGSVVRPTRGPAVGVGGGVDASSPAVRISRMRYEGYMLKLGAKHRAFKRRWFELRGVTLTYSKRPVAAAPTLRPERIGEDISQARAGWLLLARGPTMASVAS